MSKFASYPYSVELKNNNEIVNSVNGDTENKVFNLTIHNEGKNLQIKYISEDGKLLSDFIESWNEAVLALQQ